MIGDKFPSTEPSGDEAAADTGASQAPAASARPATPAARPAPKPEQTSDDTDVGWGEAPESGDAHDRWLLEQRPPHWD